MSDIVISSSVRNNLLNLQQTSDLIATTQNRLATGRKVNSALDNPTNFFTSSSLNSRANDLSNLLDGLSNGIKTLEAADNGLKSITRTIETLQSTARQARQDKSNQTQQFSLGNQTNFSLSFSGGSVGSSPVSLSFGGSSQAQQTTLTGRTPIGAELGTAFAGGTLNIGGTEVTLAQGRTAQASTITNTTAISSGDLGTTFTGGDLTINGKTISIADGATAANSTVTGQAAPQGTYTGGTLTINGINVTIADNANLGALVSTINTALDAAGPAGLGDGNAGSSPIQAQDDGNGNLQLVNDEGTTITVGGAADLLENIGLAGANNTETVITSQDGNPENDVTAATLAAELTTKLAEEGLSDITVTDSGGALQFSNAAGDQITIGGNAAFLDKLGLGDGVQQSVSSTNGVTANNATVSSVASEINAQLQSKGVTNITAADDGNGNLTFTRSDGADLTISGDADLLDTLGLGNGSATTTGTISSVTSTNGTEATDAPTVDTLVSAINNHSELQGKVRASNVNGQLRIENISTSELQIGGIRDGKIDGSTSQGTVGGNSTRANLASQFNELRSQLDRLADDAGFNGINLLRGDRLRLSFNETGTSSIDIQARNAQGDVREINSESLGIGSVDAVDFENDTELDSILNGLSNALGEIRAQSSAFGANLSSVQNRQDFTRSTINTLRTGADNLTLADVNEEAANLLSLQTRQQLSNTSLSLANQADQGVLRLF